MRLSERFIPKPWPFPASPRASPVSFICSSATWAHQNSMGNGRFTSCGATMESAHFFHGGGINEKSSARTARQQLLQRPVAMMIYGPPGSQKSFVLEHLVAELNREESAKHEPAQAAFYFYAIAQRSEE